MWPGLHALVALTLVCVVGVASALAQPSGAFTAAGEMLKPRVGHTATLLADGRVLIAGGISSGIPVFPSTVEASAELYDPSGSFISAGRMIVARWAHSATLLQDGRVLIAGGSSSLEGPDASASAELYDPVTGSFARTGEMTVGRRGHNAVLLPDGRVLIVAGAVGDVRHTAELYDPYAGTFTAIGATLYSSFTVTATLLANGTVLITHGSYSDRRAEVFDPSTGTFTATGDRVYPRFGYPVTLLRNGDALIAGGVDDGDNPSLSVELYHPDSGIFTATGNMRFMRVGHTATLLPDGTVLIAGGNGSPDRCSGCCGCVETLTSAEVYDPVTGAFTLTGSMAMRRSGHRATLLNTGDVLITGGATHSGYYVTGAELYRPSSVETPSPPTPHGPGDVNGDGGTDLLWQNRANGRLAVWYMSGPVHIGNAAIVPDQVADTAWHIVGTGDGNRDGQMDLYWQHQTTGELAIWFMFDTVRVSAELLTPAAVPDTSWKVRTVTDLDADGYPDLIWQHTSSGNVAVWFMTGTRKRSGELLAPAQVSDLDWKIVGAGDVDRDGNQDLFWHHAVSGQLAVWFMRGRVAMAGEALLPDRVADTAWQVRGVGDLDGNGSPDLVWQNTTTFQVATWLLSGLRRIDGRLITGPTVPSADWYVVGPK